MMENNEMLAVPNLYGWNKGKEANSKNKKLCH